MVFILYVSIIIFLVFLSAFFSGSETAIVSANRYRLEEMVRTKRAGAVMALKIVDDTERAVSLTLIGTNVANIMATAFITYVANTFYHAHSNILFIIMITQTLFFLLFCEIIPKIISRVSADNLLRFISYPLYGGILILSPLLSFSMWISRICNTLLRVKESASTRIKARKEIETLFHMGERKGLLEQNHRIYVDEILSMHKIKVNQVMTPTIEIVSVEINAPVKSLIRIVDRTRFSRIPVYKERVDNIVGYVYYRDLYDRENINKSITKLLRKPVYVPETKKIYELYTEMKIKNLHMVFVVNEYGAVSGMASREDIAEEIVGEIQTTDHITDELVIERGKNTFSVKGTLDIEYFCRLFSVVIVKDGFETLGGFVSSRFGQFPKQGESFVWKNYYFEIESATEKFIDRILVKKRK